MSNPLKKLARKIFGHPHSYEVDAPLPEVVNESRKLDDERDRIAKKRGKASTYLTQDFRKSTGKTLLGE